MITLYQFPSVWGLPNASPFCLKVETYLRMAEIPHEIRSVLNPKKGPKGKLPFIRVNDQIIPDSEFIIDKLKLLNGDLLDKNLSKEQKALNVALESLFSDRVYWFILYSRWKEEKGFNHTKTAFFKKLPFWAKAFIPGLVRKRMVAVLDGQGFGRHSSLEMLKMASKALDAVATILGEKKYIHGEEPNSIDATAFAFLVNIIYFPFENDLKNEAIKYPNLIRYCDRIWSTFYPEIVTNIHY